MDKIVADKWDKVQFQNKKNLLSYWFRTNGGDFTLKSFYQFMDAIRYPDRIYYFIVECRVLKQDAHDLLFAAIENDRLDEALEKMKKAYKSKNFYLVENAFFKELVDGYNNPKLGNINNIREAVGSRAYKIK